MKASTEVGTSRAVVTDLDYIVNLGYDVQDAKKALKITNGDMPTACYLLAKGTLNDASNAAWRQEMTDDWIDGVAKHSLPRDAEGRALHKTPIYIRLASYQNLDEDETKFETKVTLKDGRQWTIWRTYSSFSNMWKSLPLGTCMKFKNGFPVLSMFQFFSKDRSREFLDNRMHKLNEWIRELTLNEVCMSSSKVLKVLYDFIEADDHGGIAGIESAISQQTASVRQNLHRKVSSGTSNNSRPSDQCENDRKVGVSPLAAHQSSFRNYDVSRGLYGSKFPILDIGILPLPVNSVTKQLPCRVDLKALPTYQETLRNRTAPGAPSSVHRSDSRAESENAAIFPSDTQAKIDTSVIEAEDVIANMEFDMSTSSRVVAEESESELLGSQENFDHITKLLQETVIQPPPLPSEPAPPFDENAACAVPIAGTYAVKELPQCHAHNTEEVASDATIDCPIRIDEKQLEKDYKRDRIVIQGRKLAGSHCTLEEMLNISVSIIKQMLVDAGKDILIECPQEGAEENIEKFLRMMSQCIMQAISRTESAYFSHACLHDILDVANAKNLPDFEPFLFVPEAVLADAVECRFRIQEKPIPPTVKSAAVDERHTNASSELVSITQNEHSSVQKISPLYQSHSLSSIQKRRASGRDIGPVDNCQKDSFGGTIARPPDTGAASKMHFASDTVSNSSASYTDRRRSVGASPLLNDGEGSSTISNRRAQMVPATASILSSIADTNKTKKGIATEKSPAYREWCIICEGEASTVYRLLKCDDMTPLLQLRVTYTCTLYGFPPTQSAGRPGSLFRIKEGKSYLVIEQVMTSTSRDWGAPR